MERIVVPTAGANVCVGGETVQSDFSFCDDGLTGRIVLRTDEVDEDRTRKLPSHSGVLLP